MATQVDTRVGNFEDDKKNIAILAERLDQVKQKTDNVAEENDVEALKNQIEMLEKRLDAINTGRKWILGKQLDFNPTHKHIHN